MFKRLCLGLFLLYAFEISYSAIATGINLEKRGKSTNFIELQKNILARKEEIIKKCLTSKNYELANSIEELYKNAVGCTDEETLNRVFKIYDVLEELLPSDTDSLIDFVFKKFSIANILNTELLRNKFEFSEVNLFVRIEIVLSVLKHQKHLLHEKCSSILEDFKDIKITILNGFKTKSKSYIKHLSRKNHYLIQLKLNPGDNIARENMKKLRKTLYDLQQRLESYANEIIERIQEIFIVEFATNMCSQEPSESLTDVFDNQEQCFHFYMKNKLQKSIICFFVVFNLDKDTFLKSLTKFVTCENEKNFMDFKDSVEKIFKSYFGCPIINNQNNHNENPISVCC